LKLSVITGENCSFHTHIYSLLNLGRLFLNLLLNICHLCFYCLCLSVLFCFEFFSEVAEFLFPDSDLLAIAESVVFVLLQVAVALPEELLVFLEVTPDIGWSAWSTVPLLP